MTLADDLGLVDVSEAIGAAYILSHLEKIDSMVYMGDRIYSALPKIVKDTVVCGECEEDGLDSHSVAKVAVALSTLTPRVRQDLKRMTEELRAFVNSTLEPDEEFNGMLDEHMVELITEMVTFVQPLGSRSVRNLLHALKSANEGDWSFVMMQMKGKDSEVTVHRTIGPETKKELGI